MLRTIWRFVEILLMLLGLLAVAVIAMRVRDGEMRSAIEPPRSVSTLEDFRKWQPRHEQALKIEARGSVYYLVHGERGRLLASGPSGYVFDERRNFVGWILDTGDDSYLRIVSQDSAAKTAIPISGIGIPATPGPAGR